MKDVDSSSLAASTATSHSTSVTKKEQSDSFVYGRGGYKFWALTAILLLAFWSMFTGTVTLRWSAGNLNPLSTDHLLNSPPTLDRDFDVLEMEEREKTVMHMWDVYTNKNNHNSIGLSRFWQEAFLAAYEELTSEIPGVREAAIAEIARMSTSISTHLLSIPRN